MQGMLLLCVNNVNAILHCSLGRAARRLLPIPSSSDERASKLMPILSGLCLSSNHSDILRRFYRHLWHQTQPIYTADQRLNGRGDDVVV